MGNKGLYLPFKPHNECGTIGVNKNFVQYRTINGQPPCLYSGLYSSGLQVCCYQDIQHLKPLTGDLGRNPVDKSNLIFEVISNTNKALRSLNVWVLMTSWGT